MNNSRIFKRIFGVLATLFLMVGTVFAQGNLVITATSTFSGSGITRVAKDIVNTGVVANKAITGTVELSGIVAQSIGGGTPGSGRIDFATVKATAVSTKTFTVNSNVSTLIDVAAGTSSAFDIGVKKLTLAGAITNTGGATTPYVLNGSGAEVDYAGTTAPQTMWGTTYDKLTMSGNQALNLQAAITANNTINQSGSGALTVDQNLTAGAGYTFGTVATVSGSKLLTLSGTSGSIATLSDVAATGTVRNGSGTLTITNLTDNHGTIEASTNNGPITFTNAAVNTGAITGGSGLVAFSGALTTSGAVTSGTGNVTVAGLATINTGGSVAAGTGAALTFNGNVNNAATAGIALTGSGQSTFNGATFTNTGTLSFAGTSTVFYSRAGSQDVATASYYDFRTTGSGTKTPGGALTVTHDFDNGGAGNAAVTLDMGSNSLSLPATVDNTSATVQFGGNNNGRIIATGTVDYNATAGTQIVQGHATLTYASLLFSGSGSTKEISNASSGGQVKTTSNLSINAGVTANVLNDGTLYVLGGDLTVNGSLSNDGTVIVE